MSEKKSGWKDKVALLETKVKSKIGEADREVQNRIKETTVPEKIVFQTWGWFWTLVFGLFAILCIILFAITNPKFWITGLLAILACPIWLIICIRNMIPEIKIFGITIYSRDKLSLRQQLSVGGTIAKFFTKAFFRQNPLAVWSILGFFALFFVSIVLAVAM